MSAATVYYLNFPKTTPNNADAYKAGHPKETEIMGFEEFAEIVNLYKDSVGLKKFHEIESKTNSFSCCFDGV